jgi:glycine/serine hydroxymethyltransferase
MLLYLQRDPAGAGSRSHEDRVILYRSGLYFEQSGCRRPGGIRDGTPAMTTVGMREAEMRQIAEWTDRVLHSPDDPAALSAISKEVQQLRPGSLLRDRPPQHRRPCHESRRAPVRARGFRDLCV